MSWREWGLAILAGSIILIVTEIDKIIRIRRQRMRGHGAFSVSNQNTRIMFGLPKFFSSNFGLIMVIL